MRQTIGQVIRRPFWKCCLWRGDWPLRSHNHRYGPRPATVAAGGAGRSLHFGADADHPCLLARRDFPRFQRASAAKCYHYLGFGSFGPRRLGAIFLILELDQPFGRLIRISSEPMLNALHQFAKWGESESKGDDDSEKARTERTDENSLFLGFLRVRNCPTRASHYPWLGIVEPSRLRKRERALP